MIEFRWLNKHVYAKTYGVMQSRVLQYRHYLYTGDWTEWSDIPEVFDDGLAIHDEGPGNG